MNSTYHSYSPTSPLSNLTPLYETPNSRYLKLDNFVEEELANSANDETPNLACQFASVDVLHFSGKGFLPKLPWGWGEAWLIGDVWVDARQDSGDLGRGNFWGGESKIESVDWII